MKWVRDCCPKLDNMTQNVYGAWVDTGKVGNQPVKSDFHAENQAAMIALREAVAKGDVDRVLDMKFKQEMV